MCESDEAAREETCVKLNRTSTFAVHHKRTRTLTVTEKLRNEVKEKKKTRLMGKKRRWYYLKLDERSSISVTKNSLFMTNLSHIWKSGLISVATTVSIKFSF
jgi:hypothetical protein